MIVEYRIYHLVDGEWEIGMKTSQRMDKSTMEKQIKRWYKNHPYAKRIDKNWICGDYRIDQQRPQHNYRSDGYIKIIQMTDIEENNLSNLINNLEKNIEYPTVWDDGKTVYYEETIYCPECGKRRKVLTSKTHCEYCGFEFNQAKKCPKCNSLNLKGSEYCIKCGYKFRKKSFINNKNFEVKKNEGQDIIKCPICNTNKSKYFDKCQDCGFDFKGKKKCIKCGGLVNEKDKYCIHCGQKLIELYECKKCGKKNNINNRYCVECGCELR